MARLTTNRRTIAKASIGLGLILSLFVAFQNCAMNVSSDSSESAPSVTVSTMSDVELMTYKANLVLTNKCQSCHNPQVPSGNFDITNLDNMFFLRHVVPGEPNLSDVYKVVADGMMPPSPNRQLTGSEIQIIYDWIQFGFTNVQTTVEGTIVEVKSNYASIYARILAPRCLACHGPNRMSGGISFASYNLTMATVVAGNPNNSTLYRSVSSTTGRGGRMPQGQPALNSTEIDAIQTWIQMGAKND